jgi:tRNA(Arg) A34 adenosine deaminase TadA
MSDELPQTDLDRLRRAIAVSVAAVEHGNHPFGAILVTADGRRLEAENTVITDRDPTGHAETNLVRLAARELDEPALAASTLFTSCEPCAMCCGAIFWAGIGRVVYALSGTRLIEITSGSGDAPTLDHPSRLVFADGNRPVAVSGPHLEDEAAAPHAHFWG